MTKREALLMLATRYEQLTRELNAIAKTIGLAASHNAGNTIAVADIVPTRLRRLADQPAMDKPLTFIEPV